MNTDPIVIEITYEAPVTKVWNAITDRKAMKEWYFDIAAFKPEPGFEFQFTGEGKQGEKYLHLCKITEVVTEKKLVYSWRYHGYEGISFVTFELLDEQNKTKLKLSHTGLASFPQTNSDFAKENFEGGWSYLIGTSLKSFLEKPPTTT